MEIPCLPFLYGFSSIALTTGNKSHIFTYLFGLLPVVHPCNYSICEGR
jgi:hypothetical protein